MESNKLPEYLHAKPSMVLFQAEISSSTMEKMRALKRQSRLTWSEIVEACFQKLLTDSKIRTK